MNSNQGSVSALKRDYEIKSDLFVLCNDSYRILNEQLIIIL